MHGGVCSRRPSPTSWEGHMNELMLFEKGEHVVVSSRIVAERFAKRHNDVVNTIESKLKNLTTNNFVVENYFIASTFDHNGNR